MMYDFESCDYNFLNCNLKIIHHSYYSLVIPFKKVLRKEKKFDLTGKNLAEMANMSPVRYKMALHIQKNSKIIGINI